MFLCSVLPKKTIQVRVHGKAEPLDLPTTSKYYVPLPETWKAALCCFTQSDRVSDLEEQLRLVKDEQERHAKEGKPWEVPPCWRAYKVLPESFEFYIGHDLFPCIDRFKYTRSAEGGDRWDLVRLLPWTWVSLIMYVIIIYLNHIQKEKRSHSRSCTTHYLPFFWGGCILCLGLFACGLVVLPVGTLTFHTAIVHLVTCAA